MGADKPRGFDAGAARREGHAHGHREREQERGVGGGSKMPRRGGAEQESAGEGLARAKSALMREAEADQVREKGAGRNIYES